MWLLECDGALFQGKKLWLMPGSKHIVGRTRTQSDNSDGGHPFHGIDNKSVSRKHIIISVAENEEGASTNLSSKSILRIEDCSKFGTYVNGTKLNPGEEVQARSETTIRLGNWEQSLTLKWYSVCLTLGSISKKHMERDMASAEKKFRQLDIKISSKFEVDQTTHVVSAKRNVPAVLSGLIAGAFIVSEAYIEAILTVANPKPISSQTNPGLLRASLEEDFDGNWPDPFQFVPDPSKEPVPRESAFYHPNPDRKNIFSGITFIFCGQDQYSNLHLVVGLGGGKAFLCEEYQEGVIGPASFAEYVKSKARGKPFVVVRLQLLEPNLKWKTDFVETSDNILGQRSMPQNELLDSILTNDSSCLRQQLETVVNIERITNHDTVETSNGNLPEIRILAGDAAGVSGPDKDGQETEIRKLESSPSKSNIKRLLYNRKKTRFKGFDSFESGVADNQVMDDIQYNSSTPMVDDHLEDQNINPTASFNDRDSRKRPADLMEAILPAATAMKKRRTARGVSDTTEPRTEIVPEPKPEKKKLFKKTMVKRTFGDERNLEDVASARAREEEEQNRLDEELLKNPMTRDDFKEIRDQIEYDEVEIGTKNLVLDQSRQNWNDKWNGRKNFKMFKKQGQTEELLRGHKVIVRLEESIRTNGMLGSVRWMGSSTRSTFDNREEENDSQFIRSRNARRPDPETIELPQDDYGQQVSANLEDFPSRNAQASESVPSTNTPASAGTTSQRLGKRPANGNIAPTSKRPSTSRSRFGAQDDDASSDESEDEVRFKSFRRKK